jgi:hypothetical protein
MIALKISFKALSIEKSKLSLIKVSLFTKILNSFDLTSFWNKANLKLPPQLILMTQKGRFWLIKNAIYCKQQMIDCLSIIKGQRLFTRMVKRFDCQNISVL